MLKLNLSELINRVQFGKIKLPDNYCYSLPYLSTLESVINSSDNIRYSSARKYLVEPFYYSEKTGFLYQYIWGQGGYYYVDFALSTAECILSNVDSNLLHLIPEDMKDISALSGFDYVEFNPFCFEVANEETFENPGFIKVQSPVVNIDAFPYPSIEQIISHLPFNSKKRNKLSQVWRKHTKEDRNSKLFGCDNLSTSSQTNVSIVKNFFETKNIYSWLRNRHSGENFDNAMNSLVTSMAYFALGRGVALLHYYEGELIAIAWACETQDGKLTFLGIAQNPAAPKSQLDDIGVFSILKFIEYCRENEISVFDPTCETYPFVPSSIDTYKSKIHNQERNVYCGRMYHCKDVASIKEELSASDCPIYNLNGEWVLNDYNVEEYYVHPSKVK